MFLSFATRVYSGGGHGTGTGANTNVNGTGNPGGPGVRAHRTGWITYLVWMVDDEKIGAVKNTLVAGSERAFTLSAGSGSDGNDSFIDVRNEKGAEIYLETNFGGSIDARRVKIGTWPVGGGNTPDESKLPPFGAPFTWGGSGINGRGDDIKKDYFFRGKEGEIGGVKSKRKQIYWYVQDGWGRDRAKQLGRGELALFLEPFYWFRKGYHIKNNGNWICGTTHSYAKHLGNTLTTVTVKGLPYAVTFQKGKSLCGVSLPKKYVSPAMRGVDILGDKSIGLGITAFWYETGQVDTYNGKDSPGKPENPGKNKNKQGKNKIIKHYWEGEDINGEVKYKRVDGKYTQSNVVWNIKITDEEKLPTKKPSGFKLRGWFTGKNGYTANPTISKGWQESGSEFKKAMSRGNRRGTEEKVIKLRNDPNSPENYEHEDTLTLIFIKEKDKEGIVDTYNGEDSPGEPEDVTQDKTKQGKKKILKQYWDEFSQFLIRFHSKTVTVKPINQAGYRDFSQLQKWMVILGDRWYIFNFSNSISKI